jgi:hypothetical protein
MNFNPQLSIYGLVKKQNLDPRQKMEKVEKKNNILTEVGRSATCSAKRISATCATRKFAADVRFNPQAADCGIAPAH